MITFREVSVQRMTGRLCSGWYPAINRCSSLSGISTISVPTRFAQNDRTPDSVAGGELSAKDFNRGRTDQMTCQTGLWVRLFPRCPVSCLIVAKKEKTVCGKAVPRKASFPLRRTAGNPGPGARRTNRRFPRQAGTHRPFLSEPASDRSARDSHRQSADALPGFSPGFPLAEHHRR